MDRGHVTLTQVASPNAKHNYLLAEGPNGEPSFGMSSAPDETTNPGQIQTVKITSAHHGSGQYMLQDPEAYNHSNGWDVSTPGIMRSIGDHVVPALSFAVTQSCHAWDRCALIPRGDKPKGLIAVIPTNIYEVVLGTSITAKRAPASGDRWTGSWGRLGKRIYFGAVSDDEKTTPGFMGVMAWDQGGTDTYALLTNSTMKAMFITSQNADKLWVIDYNPATIQWTLKWTDDADGSDPLTFSASFNGYGVPRDIITLGPHCIVIVQHPLTQATEVLAVNVDGHIQTILADLSPVIQATPFLGGVLLWHMGGGSATWMRDINNFQSVTFNPYTLRMARMGFPHMTKAGEVSGGLSRGNPGGIGAVALEHELFFSMYGETENRLEQKVTTPSIVAASLQADGFHSYSLRDDIIDQVTGTFIPAMAMMHIPAATPSDDWSRRLVYIMAESVTSDTQATYDIEYFSLWDEGHPPPAGESGEDRRWLSSWIGGDSGGLKQLRSIKITGYAESASNNTMTWAVYVDGDLTSLVDSGTIDLEQGQTHVIPMDVDVIGKTFAVEIKAPSASSAAVTIEFPIELDYFSIPDQTDIFSLGIQANANQLDRMGGLNLEGRKHVLDELIVIRDSQERWTLDVWDGSTYTVMPVSLKTQETEGQFMGGAGGAVATLLLRKL